jgi:hypothetical protein
LLSLVGEEVGTKELRLSVNGLQDFADADAEAALVLANHQKASWIPVRRQEAAGARPTHGTRVCKLISEKCIAILTVIVGGW